VSGPVQRFDAAVDAWLERIRDRKGVALVGQAASRAGDFSLVWQVIGLAYGLGIDRSWRHTLGFMALVGAESLIVNQGIKRLFRRTRPTETGDARMQVRRPHTSSFPSGHASAGAFAATVLSLWAGAAWAPVVVVIAVVVASSRALVRIHHASDVVGGGVAGLVLAAIAWVTGALALVGR
jgi:undecaprenyl-diphosphatase